MSRKAELLGAGSAKSGLPELPWEFSLSYSGYVVIVSGSPTIFKFRTMSPQAGVVAQW